MALFDGLFRKLTYTQENVTKIGEAANEKGAGIELETDALERWPGKIRAIRTETGLPEFSIMLGRFIPFEAPATQLSTFNISKEV